MFKITLPQLLQYVRIGLYHIGALAMGHGITVSDSTKLFVTGLVLNAVTLAWTIWATRAAGRVNDLVGMKVIDVQTGENIKDSAAAK